MTVLQFIIDELKKYDVTDAFGIPGAVILDLIYGFEENGISTHLTYHEQAAGFAACGYAQKGNRLGVAYATKGPGFTNLITAMADAYYDSIPVLFITAHSQSEKNNSARYLMNQEMNMVLIAKNMTKFAERIERIEDVMMKLPMACHIAMQDRKGPVFLDFNTRLFMQEMGNTQSDGVCSDRAVLSESPKQISELVCKAINQSTRPVVLIGNGIRSQSNIRYLQSFCEKNGIPILSSRVSMDCMSQSYNYFGYIGSRGLRYSNYILHKCDLVISFGNRLAYNLESESFKEIMDNKQLIRLEIDESEFQREVPHARNILCDIKDVIDNLKNKIVDYHGKEKWNNICETYKNILRSFDITESTKLLIEVLEVIPEDITIVCDVGNNALWLSKAYSYVARKNPLYFSMGLSCLGNALCKAEGMYYTDKRYVVCVIGDQGLQFNVQELEFFSSNNVPVLIIVVNNNASGMIYNWEMKKYDYEWQTTERSGYGVPKFWRIADAYQINYIKFINRKSIEDAVQLCENGLPVMLELSINESEKVVPVLRKGDPCYKMAPYLSEDLQCKLDAIWDDNYE